MSKLYRARSLLYRRQILQENIRWKALDEIYKIYMFLQRSDQYFSKFCQKMFSVSLFRPGNLGLFGALLQPPAPEKMF